MSPAHAMPITSCEGPVFLDPGLQKVLTSLDRIQKEADGKDEDVSFLRSFLHNTGLQSLLKIHQKVCDHGNTESQPASCDSYDTAGEIYEFFESLPSRCPQARELLFIMADPHFRALLESHDKIAGKDYLPHLPQIPYHVDEDEKSVKIVRLVKSHEPLGATIKLNDDCGSIYIARIMHGGAADRSGLIHIGDVVHEVNGVCVRGRQPDDIVDLLNKANGPITLKLLPSVFDSKGLKEGKTRVRAHFSYDPHDDPDIPCKEAGLAFCKGDVLHIVNAGDANWWQARMEGNRYLRAGLVPGKLLQERREAARLKNSTGNGSLSRDRAGLVSPRLLKKPKKAKKIMYQAQNREEYEADEIITYEEVELYHPKPGCPRLVVLVGPPGVGRNELKKRLIASQSEHYRATIPHTSRPKKLFEIEGKEYHFVSRQDMETGIQQKRFIEYGEYKGNLYGTSLGAIKEILQSGQVCVLTPHPQSLKHLRTGELKPYVIFIKPPVIERLRATRLANNAKSTFDERCSRPFTENELNDMVLNTTKIDANFGHLFDKTLVNDDLNATFHELCATVRKLECEPQWIPVSWIK